MPAVMAAAVAAGARIINDITALTGDPESPRSQPGRAPPSC
jgi:dihydropteroate synthase